MAFQEAAPELAAEGIEVVAGSVDPAHETAELVDKLELDYPVLHSLPLTETAETLGAFYETRRSILHATGFVVTPDKTIDVACYSTGPIGRLDVPDIVRLVQFRKRMAAKQS